ncbi:MAG: hypothetical protein ACJ747_13540 [Gaiellaceae bacterium]|jgi:hypothetical protein
MPFWGWLVVGLGAWLVAAALIVLALSVFFRGVGRIVSDEHEAESWATTGPLRGDREEEPMQTRRLHRVRVRRR